MLRISIKKLLARATLRNLAIVFVESILSKVFNFFLIISIARALGPQGFGTYSLIIVSAAFLMAFLDFGMENTAVRFSAHHHHFRDAIFGLYTLVKTSAIATLFCVVLFMPGIIARLVNEPQALHYIQIIFWGAVIESYLFIITTYWQSAEQFTIRAIVNIGVYALRFIAIFTLLKLNILDVKLIAALYVLSGLPFVAGCGKHLARFIKSCFTVKIPKDIFFGMLHYQKWIIAGAVPMIMMTRLDFYVVTYFISVREAGLYNAAVELTAVLSLILMAFRKVFLPKVSKYTSLDQMKRYVRHVNLSVILVTGLALLMLPFVRWGISLALGDAYLASAGVFKILVFSFLFTFWNVLLSILFYAMGHAKLMAVGAYLQLAVFAAATVFLVPAMGMNGAALSKCISDAVYLLFVFYYLPRVWKNLT
ncbi:MAG: oligosaccharide flippase family protein [Candidatus Omnitrophota bacterium]